MPYKIKGKSVYKKTNGLKKVGKSKNPKKYKKVLEAIHRGWRPTKKK